jgi:hypothetical protein
MSTPVSMLLCGNSLEKAWTDWWPRLCCLSCVVFVVATILGTYHGADALLNQYDDSYITFRYAMNLATGKGLVFNVGEPTDAASSLLYTLVLAAAYRAGLHNLEVVSTVLGLAAVAGIVATVFWSCLVKTRHLGIASFLACVAGFSGLISGWSVTGMETVPFAFLVSATVHRLFVLRRVDWGSTLLVCLVALTRLEGILMVMAFLVVMGAHWKRGDSAKRRALLPLAATTVLTVAGFLVLKLLLYGTALPHAFLFKHVSVLYRPNPSMLWQTWHRTSLCLLVWGVAGLLVKTRRVESWVLALYVLATAGSLMTGPAADYARYSVHLLPILAVLASVPLAAAATLTPTLAVAASVLLAWQTRQSFFEMRSFNHAFFAHQACRKQVGRFIEDVLKPKTPILSSDIGAIAYAAPSASFIDTIALTSANILLRRAASEGVDDILARAKDGFVADTCHGPCRTFQSYSAHDRLVDESAWRTAVPASNYYRDFGPVDPLFICRTPDGLGFAISGFGRQ